MRQSPIAVTQQWVTDFVVGLNLCPFAKGPLRQGTIRWVSMEENTLEALTPQLLQEIGMLIEHSRDEIETTLIVLPNIDFAFQEFWDYLGLMEELAREVGAAGLVQLVGFHPDFRFAGEAEDDPSAYTNRSPYPMIHILREESVEKARLRYPEVHDIPARNRVLLQELGEAHIRKNYLK